MDFNFQFNLLEIEDLKKKQTFLYTQKILRIIFFSLRFLTGKKKIVSIDKTKR